MSTSSATVRDDTRLVLERRIDAPPAAVWAAWTEAQALSRWFGPDGVEVLEARLDVRVGGAFHVVMRSGDGEEHRVSGVYREVAPPRRLVFTWAWRSTPERESLVTVSIDDDGAGGSVLTLSHERFADAEACALHRAGWSGALGKLARTLV